MTTQSNPAAEQEALKDLATELEKARLAKEARLKGWKPMKDPGQLMAGMWDVGIVDGLSYSELHKIFGDAWVWGPNVRVMKDGENNMATQFGVADPEGRHWSLFAEWPRNREVPKETVVRWYLTGTGTDFDAVGDWLAGLVGRTVTITANDSDEKATFNTTFAYTSPKE